MVVEARHVEKFPLFGLEVFEELAEMSDEHANVVLVEGGEGQNRAELDEESKQVECTVDLRHGLVRILL